MTLNKFTEMNCNESNKRFQPSGKVNEILRGFYADLTKGVRYVLVIWFIFHVFQLLLIRFTQQNSFCVRKSKMKHLQKSD